MRNFNFQNSGKMNSKEIDAETMSYIQAFSDGINAYAQNTQILPI